MPDDIEALALWMSLPETNAAVVNALLDDCMAPGEYVGLMKVLNVVLVEDQS